MPELAINGGAPVRTAPFTSWPIWDDGEADALMDVLKGGKWGSIHGNRVKEFEEQYAAFHQAKYGVCVNSGTTALTLALQAVGVGQGDEVLLPCYTFIATATAIIDTGAVPVFVDINPETYNIDLSLIEDSVTDRTKAVMPVHFGGRPVEMDVLLKITEKHDLKVVEDAAQAWGSEWKGRKVGAIGNAGCFSFQSSKNITSAEGGIILTNEDETEKFARSFSNCGRLPDGLWYEHYYLGGNYRMTEFQGVILQTQFDRYPALKEKREKNARFLNEHLSKIEGVGLLKEDPNITGNSYHLYIWRYNKSAFHGISKSRFLEAMGKEGVSLSAGYSIPLYTQPVFKNHAFGPMGREMPYPVDYGSLHLSETEKACYEEAVWIPQAMLLGSEEDMSDIVRAIEKVQTHAKELL